ncbi:MAG TPA: hypothetical protein VNE41_04570 [Chitinophagaceae bacterium]|nr:hypothetical protein [Chitinophagaceae bacterium]
MKEYTYNEWFNGDFGLSYSTIYFQGGKKPIICKWEDIVSEDILKIKTKQREIFNRKCKMLLKKWKNIFSTNYKRSEFKDKYLENEIYDFQLILLGGNETIQRYVSFESLNLKNHTTITFLPEVLFKIREYINNVIIQGKVKTYDFIQSPKFPFQRENEIGPEIYANALWNYLKYLRKLFESKKKNLPKLDSIETEGENPDLQQMISEIKIAENRFWKALPMEIVVTHFEVFTKRKSKNGNLFLTTEQFIHFLKMGFLNETNQPKQRINCSKGEKGFIIARFYQLFDLAASKYGYPGKKEGFIELFMNCFDNWERISIKMFFKPNKTKGKW